MQMRVTETTHLPAPTFLVLGWQPCTSTPALRMCVSAGGPGARNQTQVIVPNLAAYRAHVID